MAPFTLLPLAAHLEILSFTPWSAQITAVACASKTTRRYATVYKDQAPIPTQFWLSCLQPFGESCLRQFGLLFVLCVLPALAPLEYPVRIVALRVECPRLRVSGDAAFQVWFQLLTALHDAPLRMLSVTAPSMSSVAFWELLRAVQDVCEIRFGQLVLVSVEIHISYGLLRRRGFGYVQPKRQKLLVCLRNLLSCVREVRVTVRNLSLSRTDMVAELLASDFDPLRD